jgi:hypothetical protein
MLSLKDTHVVLANVQVQRVQKIEKRNIGGAMTIYQYN